MHTKTLTLLAALVTATAGAQAAPTGDNYVGAAIGARTHYGLDCVAGDSCDRNANASGKVYFGQNYTPNLGVEAMAFRLGSAKGSIDNGNGRSAGKVRAEGIGLSAVARAQLDAVTFKARLGAAYEHGHTSYAAGGSSTKNSLVPVVGVGASLALNKQWALTADWDHFGGRFNSRERAGVSLFSLGAAYSF